jgi:hypothetical protein
MSNHRKNDRPYVRLIVINTKPLPPAKPKPTRLVLVLAKPQPELLRLGS